MSLQRCMAETTSTEFVQWQQYFTESLNYPEKEDYYLAQIAAEIRRGMTKNPETIRVEHFLMKFVTGESKKLTKEDLEERVKNSKARWRAFLHGGGTKNAIGN